MNFGIIGCGGIADRRTIPGMIKSDMVNIIAVMDINEGISKSVAEKYKIPRYYTNEDDIIKDDDIEALYIATPVYLHLSQIKKSADAGKHILSEKPLGLNTKETEEIIDYCEKKGVTLQVGFMMRYHGYHKKARDMVKNGVIGHPVMGRAQLTCWYPPIKNAWRQDPSKSGGGALMDMAIHSVDILRYMFGDVKEVVSFNGNITHNYPVEDSGIIMLNFKGGTYGICDSFFNIPDEAAKGMLEIYGTKGSLLAEGTIGQIAGGNMVAYIQEQEEYDAEQNRGPIKPLKISADLKDIYQAEVEDFISAIENKTIPMNSGIEALKNIRVIEAAYQSQKSGKVVRI